MENGLEMEASLASLQLEFSRSLRGAQGGKQELKAASEEAGRLADSYRRTAASLLPTDTPYAKGSNGEWRLTVDTRREFEPRRAESRLTPSRPRSVRFKEIVTDIDPDVDIEFEGMGGSIAILEDDAGMEGEGDIMFPVSYTHLTLPTICSV